MGEHIQYSSRCAEFGPDGPEKLRVTRRLLSERRQISEPLGCCDGAPVDAGSVLTGLRAAEDLFDRAAADSALADTEGGAGGQLKRPQAGDVDLAPVAFNDLSDPAAGRIKVSWTYNN